MIVYTDRDKTGTLTVCRIIDFNLTSYRTAITNKISEWGFSIWSINMRRTISNLFTFLDPFFISRKLDEDFTSLLVLTFLNTATRRTEKV